MLSCGRSVMAGSESSMAAKACEMTLVRIPDSQSRIHHAPSRSQQIACMRNPNALQICMRGKAYRFRECMRNVKGATRSQCTQLWERDIFRVMRFQVLPDLLHRKTIFSGGGGICSVIPESLRTPAAALGDSNF